MAIDPITAALEIGGNLIKRLFPDPTEQARQTLKLQELAQQGNLAELNAEIALFSGQLEINKIEAGSKSLFVAGWRPFIGWCCGFGLAYASIIEPIMRFIAKMYGYTADFPTIDTSLTMQVLIGMLGLGVMRTHEKTKNVHNDSLK